jgi:flavin-dependent dehydrogenase
MSEQSIETDVAIVGGGPAGSTCAILLKKYDPSLRVAVFEREAFPRDHVGESLLPMVCGILDEMGVWNRVEECGFPIKVGATYRWGNTPDLWDFNFIPRGEFVPQVRPAAFDGQRKNTTFQVDRAIYDKVLGDYSRELGCDVRYESPVREVLREGDRITALGLGDGTKVRAKYYVDASGHSGIIRRSMGVEIEEPALLRNIAIWDYWTDAEWAVQLGIGGTRVQVLSLGYGWIWFVQISDCRTSVGLVCPAEYYKNCGKTPEQLYLQAIGDESRVTQLLANAKREGRINTTKDWSFIAKRMTGENWFLAGESQGFADPILAAGLSLAHTSAREVACIILEANRGGDLNWFREEYGTRNDRRIRQHIRFADYWYTANGNFSDLKEYVASIAKEAGLDLDGEKAFQWLGTGGFIEEEMGAAGFATLRLDLVHQVGQRFSATPPVSSLNGYNWFTLNLDGAEEIERAHFRNGRITKRRALKRGNRMLPLSGGYFGLVIEAVKHSPRLDQMVPFATQLASTHGLKFDGALYARFIETFEAMIRDGWINRELSANAPVVEHQFAFETPEIMPNTPGR